MSEKEEVLQDVSIWLQNFLDDKMIKQSALAKKLNIQPSQLNETLQGKRKLSIKLAFGLERTFGKEEIKAEDLLRRQFEFELEALKELRKTYIKP